MPSIVRDSKFRHVFGETLKEKYEDLRLSAKPSESCGIQASSKFFAFPWESGGGGTLACVPLTRIGRLPRDIPLITGHCGTILDFEFSPFNDNLLLSCSEDMTVKLWQIPDEGLKTHLKDPLVNLEGHGKKVSFCSFNPVADGIVASVAFDQTLRIWNFQDAEQVCKIDLPEGVQVSHMKWNYNGSLIAVTCKDKKLRIYDPRTNEMVAGCKIHEGVKASKVEWIGSNSNTDECHKLITTGFSSQAERQLMVFDTRTFGKDFEDVEALYETPLDQGTGSLFPTFDAGTQMLYIAGKGDGNVRYFELTAEEPYLHYLDAYKSTTPQKGFTFLPKRCVDVVPKHEIMKGLKLEATAVQPVSFRVPRKSEVFQEDLFPDCKAATPAMNGEAWVSSSLKEARQPILQSLKPGASVAQNTSAAPAMVSVKDLKKQLADAQERIQALEKENGTLKEELTKLKG